LAVVRDEDEITAITNKETNGRRTKWVCYFCMFGNYSRGLHLCLISLKLTTLAQNKNLKAPQTACMSPESISDLKYIYTS
jgi:hypothetical protein